MGVEESYFAEVARILSSQIDVVSQLYGRFSEAFPASGEGSSQSRQIEEEARPR